jgi:hypothetical protein
LLREGLKKTISWGRGPLLASPVSAPDGNGLKDQYADGNVLMEPSRRKNASE